MSYIEREALMQYPIRIDHYDKEHGNEHFVLGIESVLEYAENLPTADVAPVRHGKILETIENGKMKRVFTCCGKDFTTLTQWYMPDYCPNCGAKMDMKE